MDTLRAFVAAVLPEPQSDRIKFLSVPDQMSESFELRRLLAPQTRSRPITDFFEYYWAYQVCGTQFRHLAAWLKMLLFRKPWNVPRRLISIWVMTWVLVVAIAIASLRLAPLLSGPPDQRDITVRILSWVFSVLLLPLVSGFAFGYLGDAARYLSPTPQNIAVRHRIRRDGVQLLRKLHRCGKYDRILVVGHSLGSVIGYDILKHYWQEVNNVHGSPLRVEQSSLENVEHAASLLDSSLDGAGHLQQFRSQQRELWLEQRRLGNPWLVTDLVTVGSPLSHAAILLANTPAELRQRQGEMELPMSPPKRNLDRKFAYRVNYDVQNQRRTLRVLHHAAMFACTRWTNIYFPGDFVAGPVAPVFGLGVEDKIVRDSWVSSTPLSHTRYWPRSVTGAKLGDAVNAIREALDLDCKNWVA